MPSWGEILKEVASLRKPDNPLPFDQVRRKYLAQLQRHTNRNTILYATNWTQSKGIPGELVSITMGDVEGFMEAFHGLKGSQLDIILHCPGGTLEAVEALMSYMRAKFDDVRVIVPHAAMSAATLLACGANRIVMGKHSFLGPIDPQFFVQTQVGPLAVPAQAILDQFELARTECQDPRLLGAWIPILGQYGPALLIQCKSALKLSRELAAAWLERYMFKGRSNAHEDAESAAARLADHAFFKSHGRPIPRDLAKQIGLTVDSLEDDQVLQDLVLSVYHATSITFDGTPATKIIENHAGKAFVKRYQQLVTAIPQHVKAPQPGEPPSEKPRSES
jgi:hypothetical protein